jgi:hypothetical protein
VCGGVPGRNARSSVHSTRRTHDYGGSRDSFTGIGSPVWGGALARVCSFIEGVERRWRGADSLCFGLDLRLGVLAPQGRPIQSTPWRAVGFPPRLFWRRLSGSNPGRLRWTRRATSISARENAVFKLDKVGTLTRVAGAAGGGPLGVEGRQQALTFTFQWTCTSQWA